MHSKLVIATIIAIAIVPRVAGAQASSWNATVNGQTAVTDNVFAAPTDGNRELDIFFQIRPGILFTRGSPRLLHDVSADAEILHYALNSKFPSVNGRANWRMLAILGQGTQMYTSVGGGTGQLVALGSQSTPDESLLTLQPVGRVTIKQADAQEYLSHVVNRDLRLSQSLFARFDESNDRGSERSTADMTFGDTILSSAEAGFSLGIERSFRRDSVSLELGGSVQRFERDAPPEAIQGPRLDRQVAPRLRVQWRHDLTRRRSFTADAGVVAILPFGADPDNPDEQRENGLFPIAGAQVNFFQNWGRAAVAARRDVTPSQFIAENTINDSLIGSAAVPLVWIDNSSLRQPKYTAVGLVAFQRTRIIDSATSDLRSSIYAGRVDLGITYQPDPGSGLSYGLRYELIVQSGDADAVMAVTGFFRNTLYATFTYRYPERVLARVPKRKPGQGVRADRKDLVPFGAEPIIPDLIETEGTDAEDER